jgi:hypothetical protein
MKNLFAHLSGRSAKPEYPINSAKSSLFSKICIMMLGGFTVLAIIDPTCREPFVDLAQLTLGAFVGQYLQKL